MEIFHAERFACDSQFLFYESGVDFVTLEEQKGDQPKIDFDFEVEENVPVDRIIGQIILADPFSIGMKTLKHFTRFLLLLAALIPSLEYFFMFYSISTIVSELKDFRNSPYFSKIC